MTQTCELTIEPHALDGQTNMDRDAQMLHDAVENGRCRLRFYEWSQPTISLGYFQKGETVPNEFSSLPTVKRLSGGGAILHDHEMTYSLALPAGHTLSKKPTALYALIHDQIISILAEQGIDVRLRGVTNSLSDDGEEPFLCFLRRDQHDLVLGQHKVLGSAQRRRKGAILQHGSLLLNASAHAENLPGINDISEFPVECSVIRPRLASALQQILDYPGIT